MIRKYIFAVLSFVFACCNQNLWSQDCSPVSMSTPGILPEALPFAQKDLAYNETISVMLFADTLVERQGQTVKAVMDSMVMDTILGLPTGITYTVKNNNPKFLPMVPSCISIYGTPTELGVYPLEIPIVSYAKVLGFVPINQTDTIRDYILEVVEEGASIKKIVKNQLSVFPNPAQNQIYVVSNTIPTIMDATGKVLNMNWEKRNTLYVAKVEDLPVGIYMVIGDGKSSRFVKN